MFTTLKLAISSIIDYCFSDFWFLIFISLFWDCLSFLDGEIRFLQIPQINNEKNYGNENRQWPRLRRATAKFQRIRGWVSRDFVAPVVSYWIIFAIDVIGRGVWQLVYGVCVDILRWTRGVEWCVRFDDIGGCSRYLWIKLKRSWRIQQESLSAFGDWKLLTKYRGKS